MESQWIGKQVLERFLDSYLVERDAEKTISLVTDDIYSLGTGKQEVACSKEEFRKLIYSEMEQLPQSIAYSLENYREKSVVPGVFVCFCDVTTCMAQEGQPEIWYSTRLTAGFKQTEDGILAYHLHMSEPSAVQQDYEFFPLHYGKTKSRKIDAGKQIELVELMRKMLPGGAMGGYVEPGFPLYFINDELLQWLGYTYEEFIEENGQLMSNTMHPEDVDMVDAVIRESFARGNEYAVEYRMRKKDNSYIWVRDIGRKTLTDDGRVAMISVIADITNEKLRQHSFETTIESMKRERRRTDRMTELLNREPAEVLIEQYLLREQTGAFFLMDIDNFKLVNDLKGHPAGDRTLHAFAEKMKQIFPQTAVLARLGGDEFIAFLPRYEDMKELRRLAEHMIAEAEHLIDDKLLAQKLGVSVGIALAPEHGREMNTLYSNADKGLYYAKRNGKNGYSFYMQSSTAFSTEEIHSDIHTLRRMIQEVLVDKGAFKVEYNTFNNICQFVLRNAKRLKQATQILLFSLSRTDGAELDEEQLQKKKKELEKAIQYGLRIGDLLMDFSASQVAVLLVNCDEENARHVAERVVSSYTAAAGQEDIRVSYEWGSIREEAGKTVSSVQASTTALS